MLKKHSYKFFFYCIQYIKNSNKNIVIIDYYLVVHFKDNREAVYHLTPKEQRMLEKARKDYANKIK